MKERYITSNRLLIVMLVVFMALLFTGPFQASAELLVVAAPDTPPSFDPDMYAGTEYEFIIANIYDPPLNYKVVEQDGLLFADTGKPGDEGIQGSLIESWELSDDGMTYTFHLRQGVYSYYGNELTADDFIWRVERAYALSGSGKFQYDITGITGPQDLEKVDKYTVKVTTPHGPNPVLFKGFCVPTTGFFDSTEAKKHATEDDPWAREWLARNSAGFGPYHVSEIRAGERMVLVANPNYWQGEPYFQRVIWQVIPEDASRFSLMERGDIHFVGQFLNFRQLKEMEGGRGEAVLVSIAPTNAINMVQLQCTSEPFKRLEARQALAYAIPYDQIIESAYFDLAVPAKSHIPPVFSDATEEFWPYEQDLAKAEELWRASGAPWEFTLYFDIGMPEHEQTAIMIKSAMESFGVTVNLRKLPASVFSQRMNDSTMEAWLHWSASWVPDVGYNTWMWWGEAVFNFKEYSNDEVNALVDASMAMLDSPERTEKLISMQEILVEEVPSITLNWPGWHQVMHKNLEGLTWYPDNWVRFFQLQWKE